MTALARRDLLRGDLRGRRAPLRPPWALPEAAFAERCDGCRACVRACPEGILAAGWSGIPEVDFGRGACTFCGACAEACTRGALERGRGAPWTARARITEACLALRGIACGACVDACDRGALRLRPVRGGVAVPRLDPGACDGCGACVAPCPAAAVEVRELVEEAEA